jgi:hypothetical protein
MTTKDPIRVALEALEHARNHISADRENCPGCDLATWDKYQAAIDALSQPAVDATPIAEIVSAYGDPEAFGEREIKVLADIQKLPYGTKLYVSRPADVRRAAMLKCAAACDARADDHDNGVFNNFRVKKRDEARACAAAIRALAQKEAGK